MNGLEIAGNTPVPELAGFELERQLHLVEKHYADARHAAETARDELRALLVKAVQRPGSIAAARAKFEAVAARCSRLLRIIEDLEARIDAS